MLWVLRGLSTLPSGAETATVVATASASTTAVSTTASSITAAFTGRLGTTTTAGAVTPDWLRL
jgi:hypothetical protein